MKVKAMKLVRTLLEYHPISALSLSERLNISVRSVKSYVKEINELYPNAITSSREGYSIDLDIAKLIINTDTAHIPQTSQERVTYIINQLIHHNGSNRVIDAYDLCDEMFVSMSTLQKELGKVKGKLQEFDLQLTSKGDLLQVIGLEKNKRKLLSSILYDESNVNFINLKSLQNAFININIERIKEIATDTFNKYHYFINDYSLINLVLHITICIDRVRNNYISANDETVTPPAVKYHEYEMAQDIAHQIEKEFYITLNKAEVYEMTLLIVSRATTIDYKSVNEGNIEDFIGKDCMELVYDLIQGVNMYYYINLNEKEFLVRFALHIRNLLVRAQNNYFSKNPLTEAIKTSCPLIYDASVIIADEIREKTGILINDDEIAYIAFHLGSTLEEQKMLQEKISAVLYCPNYYDISMKLVDSISERFNHSLLITNILTDESNIDKITDADLIISTIPLSKVASVPVLQISFYCSSKDYDSLREKIKELQNKKKKDEFRLLLTEMIRPDFFRREKTFINQEHCIDYMVEQLYENGYVENTFKAEVMYRESVSSTAFGSFAIPHAMKMYAKKTGMYIVITDDSIDWGKHHVNLVIMMCFNPNERHLFNKTFEPITMILSEPENVKKIIASKNYTEFIDKLVELL